MSLFHRKSLNKAGFAALLISAAIPLTSGRAAPSSGTIPPSLGLGSTSDLDPQSGAFDIGTGYNSLLGLERNIQCVQPTKLRTIQGDGQEPGQDIVFTLKEITSYEELRQELDVKAGGAFGYGGFETNTKTSFYKSSSFNRYSYFLLIKVRVANQTEHMTEYRLTKDARNLLAAGDSARFLQACGNEFVASITRGGEFSTIIEIETSSSEDKKKLQSELKLTNFGWSAHADIQKNLEHISKNHSLKTYITRRGPTDPLAIEPLEAIKYAREFPQKVRIAPDAKPWVYKATTLDYGVILNLPSTTGAFNLQQRVMNAMAVDLQSALESRNEVSYVLMNQGQFKDPNINELNQYMGEISRYINQLNLAHSLCAESPFTACSLDPSLRVPTMIRLPERQGAPREVSTVLFGGSDCSASNPSACSGLKNDGVALDTGLRVRPGDRVEVVPSFLLTEKLQEAPSMPGKRVSHIVEITETKRVCRRGCSVITKKKEEDHWTQTTRYPGVQRNPEVKRGSDAEALLANTLALRFVWRDEEGNRVEKTCGISSFESAAAAEPLHVRIEDRPHCAVFPEDKNITPRMYLVNQMPSNPVTYREGHYVDSWEGVKQKPVTKTSKPVSILAGQVRVH